MKVYLPEVDVSVCMRVVRGTGCEVGMSARDIAAFLMFAKVVDSVNLPGTHDFLS